MQAELGRTHYRNGMTKHETDHFEPRDFVDGGRSVQKWEVKR
jgi:hypothetical protein